MQPEKMTPEQINGTVRLAVQEAVDFCESELADDRIKAQKAYDGHVNLTDEEDRSTVVATKVRDTIRMVKPALMRVFLQNETPVEFVPVGREDVQAAEQATKYVNHLFNKCGGFQILQNAFHDAMLKKYAITKAYWDETEETEIDEYSNLQPPEWAFITMDPEAQVLEEEQNEDGTISGRVVRVNRKGQVRIDLVAPEDFFVDRKATGFHDFYVCGDSAEMRVGDVMKMEIEGLTFDRIYELSGDVDSTTQEEEKLARDSHDTDDQDEAFNDPSMRPILVTEAYMRMDIEGTGIPRLYQFTCLGDKYEVVDYREADAVPYSKWEADPQPHTFHGDSLAEMVMEDQDAATSLLRGLIDNVHMSNNPALVVDTTLGNVQDALNKEYGPILRSRGQGAYTPLVTPFTAQYTLPALEYYDRSIETKTGVTKSSMGMEPDALQSTTAAGVNAAVQAATAQVELMARNLAEGGCRDLFRKMATLVRQHAHAEEIMSVAGSFVPVDPRSWRVDMDLRTNVGLGTGKHDERIMALREILQGYQTVAAAGIPPGILFNLENVRNAQADLAKLQGIHNLDRYFPSAEQVTQAQQMLAQQPQGQQGDPNAAYMQAEGMKVQQREMEAQRQHQLDVWKAVQEDDRKRDQMEQEAEIKAAQILGEFGIKISAEQIRQMQARQRAQVPQG